MIAGYRCPECGWSTDTAPLLMVCVACWVRASTAAQGLQEKVTDPLVLRQVAALPRA